MARLALNKLTVKELEAAQIEIAQLIEAKKRQDRDTLKAKLEDLAAQGGFSVHELFNGNGATKKKGGTVAPKYRNPENADQLWSGRGRQPLWFAAALKKGVKPEKLMIK